VNETITILRSEYENLKREISELRSLVEQLRDEISLLKDGKGADRYAKIRSVVDTTIKNGQDVYADLVCLANCKIVEVPE